VTGRDGGGIDQIGLFGEPSKSAYDCRNFVLCPGMAYDRSPCGTGTSARLACLAADGTLAEGETWMQESIVGSVFEGSVSVVDGAILPHIKGSAFITAEAALILDVRDPFCMGIRG
jgi:4-hydroxyproline epimerase